MAKRRVKKKRAVPRRTTKIKVSRALKPKAVPKKKRERGPAALSVKPKPITPPQKKKSRRTEDRRWVRASFAVFMGFFILGVAFGILFENTIVGALIGMGVGFLGVFYYMQK